VTGEGSCVRKAVVASVGRPQALNDRPARFRRLTTSIVMSSPVAGKAVAREALRAGLVLTLP
jgi:hypothetical protein